MSLLLLLTPGPNGPLTPIGLRRTGPVPTNGAAPTPRTLKAGSSGTTAKR